jgi:hypothetical protein
MCSSGSVRLLIVTAILFFAVSLPAQRYYGRDHHVYHPPAPAKHQTSQQPTARAHAASTTAANNTAHNASATAPYQVPAANSKPDVMTPPNAGERQPQ